MPIYLTDSTGPDGKIETTGGGYSCAFVGSAAGQVDVDGSINRAMDPFTASFRDGVNYPLTYTARGGTLNLYQTGTAAETDRKAIGLMNACHIIGFNSGNQADSTPPVSGYMSRVNGNKEILAASPDGSHYLCTYFVFTEAADSDTEKVAYIETLDGPGTDDGWAYNSAGERVILFAGSNSYTINLSDHVADKNGLNYCEWHADNFIQPKYIDPHIVGGVKIGGPGGINVMLDNFQHHSNKSGIDWNNDGSNNDAQDYYDLEESNHTTGNDSFGQPRLTAATAYASVRATQMSGVERIRSNNPGIFLLPNTNQWADKPNDRLDKPESFAELRNCILEYRLSGATDQANVEGGFSEGNSGNSNYRSGVFSDGSAAPSGDWLQTYFNTYQSVRLAQDPSIIACSFWVQCLESSLGAGPGGKHTWSPVPASNAKWSLARWAMATAWIAGAHAAITGIQVGASTAGRAQSTPLFDEYGLINGSVDYGFGTGSTKLYKGWMGKPKEDPPITARADGSWGREFDNAYVILNPNGAGGATITIDVSALPGGASEWTRFNGSQDTVINNGVAATVDFNMSPVDAIVLPRKSWYDAL